MSDNLLKSAENYERLAEELEVAAKHYRIAAKHFRDKEVPRGCAHAFSGWGHINKAELVLKEESIFHANHSNADLG